MSTQNTYLRKALKRADERLASAQVEIAQLKSALGTLAEERDHLRNLKMDLEAKKAELLSRLSMVRDLADAVASNASAIGKLT